MSAWLVCGVAGTVFDDQERDLLLELGPGGVILFARNVESREQLAELVSELRSLPSRPYVAVDLEGGRVNRLERLIGPLPTAARAALTGTAAVNALGEAVGAACAHFGIGVDFAPVVDVAWGGGWLGEEERCLGANPRAVVRAASEYLAGLEGFGVAGCLKHYPGLGSGAVDSHHELPVLDDPVKDEEVAFLSLLAAGRALMVAHALVPALGEAFCPASLSSMVVGRIPKRNCGPIIADDLEMGALARYGSVPERAAAALAAGCDQVLVCNALSARRDVVEHVAMWVERDAVLAAALGRAEERVAGFGTGELAPVTWSQVQALAERVWRLAGEGT